jgi:Lon-like protease
MRRLVALLLVVAAVVGLSFFIPSDHYLFLPDPARPVDPLVAVPGETGAAEAGGVYMVDILVRKASLFERVFPGVENGSSLVSSDHVNPTGVSERERRRTSLNEMSRSQEIAVTVALRSLGYEVKVERKGAEVASVVPGKPAEGALQVGDVVVSARGRPVRTREDLLELMKPVAPGESVPVTIVRDGRRRDVRLETTADEQDKSRAVFGILVQQAADFDFPVNVRIDAGDIGGPSAGLAFALDVVDELGRDLDRGRRIAVTGELGLDGKVGAIGGIKQKTIGAHDAGAQLFLVPDENAPEARRYAQGLEVVAVSTFDEAMASLNAD